MESLEKIAIEYQKYISYGYNTKEAAEKAVRDVLPKQTPHIYTDSEGGASHVFAGGGVLHFPNSIYISKNPRI